MGITTDPNDPRLKRGPGGNGQNEAYLVLSREERRKGFVRPIRTAYVHEVCGVETNMGWDLSETYARQPSFYGATYCVACKTHFPVNEFRWATDGTRVGS